MTNKRRPPILWTPAGYDAVHADGALFRARQGHGFAAERANHLIDLISGENAELVGGANVKNGPDRVLNGEGIQTKYHQSGARGIAACFRQGRYRYLNSDGTLMRIEVPRDQYNAALRAMQRRILQGNVPGLEDPLDAARLVKKGAITYRQAVNVAKFGTIDSLSYDAVNGVRVGGIALGVSATVAYAMALWRGETPDEALGAALATGVQVGGVAWSTSALAAQFGRTRLGTRLGPNVLTAAAATIVLSSPHFRPTLPPRSLRGPILQGRDDHGRIRCRWRRRLAVGRPLGRPLRRPRRAARRCGGRACRGQPLRHRVESALGYLYR